MLKNIRRALALATGVLTAAPALAADLPASTNAAVTAALKVRSAATGSWPRRASIRRCG